jgi:hypothetical protein
MNTNATFATPSEFLRRTGFILVDDRISCAGVECAPSCCKILKSYVRD